MKQEEVVAKLRETLGATAVKVLNGTVIVETDQSFKPGGYPSKLSPTFKDGLLEEIIIVLIPYCVYQSDEVVANVSDLLHQKYPKLAVDFSGFHRDYSDGRTRVQIRSFTDGRCNNSAMMRRHFTLTYMPEVVGQARDIARRRADDIKKERVLQGL